MSGAADLAPRMLVSPAQTEAMLGTPGVRVIDCTVRFQTRPVGASTIHSGHDDWLKGHVPGAAYLHMVDDLSDPQGAWPFAIAPQAQIDAVLSRIGVRAGDTVILYGGGTPVAVTRAWWVLTVSGLADVRIMDGGWMRWVDEGRPIATGSERFVPSVFRGVRDADAVAGRADMLAALSSGSTVLVNALSPEQHAGTGGTHYGRPGRVPGSVNCPASAILDPVTGRFADPDTIRQVLGQVPAGAPAITYCGGGIAAAAALFALRLTGHGSVRLYDNSLLEWSADPDLPMETD